MPSGPKTFSVSTTRTDAVTRDGIAFAEVTWMPSVNLPRRWTRRCEIQHVVAAEADAVVDGQVPQRAGCELAEDGPTSLEPQVCQGGAVLGAKLRNEDTVQA